MPGEWRRALEGFRKLNAPHRTEIAGKPAPSGNDEYLLYQAVLGAWPMGEMDPTQLATFRARIREYMLKAIREAKVHTSWTNPDPDYEEATTHFVDRVLDPGVSRVFLDQARQLKERLERPGQVNSLVQLALKLASPGVPDIYQGCELWDLSLVDPDNRRPVDYEFRRRMLDELRGSSLSRAEQARALYARWQDGRIKLLLTHAGLTARKEHPDLFTGGGYLPLAPQGPRAGNLCAFARIGPDGQMAIAVAPRLVAGLLDGPVLPARIFAGTFIPVPRLRPGEMLRDALTGEDRHVSGTGLAVDQLFATLPVALLISRRS
jgi:(1->4)-alpha-D-glucan 1-alpha-D-glucosylmutase